MKRYHLSTAMMLAASLTLVGCADDDGGGGDDGSHPFEQETTEAALYEQGTFKVGHVISSVSYVPVGETEARELPVRVWYPAPADATGEAADYAVGGIVDIGTERAIEEPPVADGGRFPLVVYSHGSGGDNLLAYPYAEILSSRGWIVVSANHVGNTALDGISETLLPFDEVAVKRVTDISAMLDAAPGGFGVDALRGRVDIDDVFLFGHSFGAYTTLVAGGGSLDYDRLLATCGEDECAYLANDDVEAAIRAGLGDDRIDAIAPQAPAVSRAFSDSGYADITIPTMLMSGEEDKTTTEEEETLPVWNGLNGHDDVWVDIPTGAHFTFISICDDLSPALIALFQSDAPEDGCGGDFIPTLEAIPILTAYITAFAEHHVLGVDAWDTLLRPPSLDERFEFERRVLDLDM